MSASRVAEGGNRPAAVVAETRRDVGFHDGGAAGAVDYAGGGVELLGCARRVSAGSFEN